MEKVHFYKLLSLFLNHCVDIEDYQALDLSGHVESLGGPADGNLFED